MTKKRIIVGISGASGAVYGIEMLKTLRTTGVESHLVVSKTAQITIAHETPYTLPQVHALADHFYSPQDLASAISSGSFKTEGMVVAPCSMRTLAEIATANTSSLLTRAADVVLKERRKLVLMVRETPLTNAHIKNMLSVSEMGGIIAPPVPAYYNKPQTIQDIVGHTVGRILDILDINHELVTRWEGLNS